MLEQVSQQHNRPVLYVLCHGGTDDDVQLFCRVNGPRSIGGIHFRRPGEQPCQKRTRSTMCCCCCCCPANTQPASCVKGCRRHMFAISVQQVPYTQSCLGPQIHAHDMVGQCWVLKRVVALTFVFALCSFPAYVTLDNPASLKGVVSLHLGSGYLAKHPCQLSQKVNLQ
jgi:hypothetical protein